MNAITSPNAWFSMCRCLARRVNRLEAMNNSTKAKPDAIIRTLSLVMHRVRFLKKLAKTYISIQWGMKLKKPSILVVN
jgi:hypothetical protein